MRFLRTNTAVIITVGPFLDKTDGVTIEGSLTITNERITLTADTDAGSAPTLILDNVTGATAATANDLNYITNNDAGLMQLELSAADTNRLGRMFLTITDAANHVPVFHEFMVLPAMIYDALILGTDRLDTNVTHVGDTAQTAGDIGAITAAQAEPAQGAPAVNATPLVKIAWLYKFWRNKKTNDASTVKLYDDAGTTVDSKFAITDSAGTTTTAEVAAGP